MASKLLLEMVQTVLETLGESQVDSVSETDRSLQVAHIVRDVYEEGLAERNWAHKTNLTSLQPYGIDKPTYLIIPDTLKEIDSIYYDVQRVGDNRKKYQKIDYKDPIDFLDFVNSRNSSNSNVEVIDDVSGTEILIKNDKPPQFWTSFDQDYVVFDSYDSAVESTIQESKQQVYGVLSPGTFLIEDDFVIDIPDEAFPWLLAEVKATASVDIAQEVNPKAEQKSRRQKQQLSRKARVAGTGRRLAKFGRKGFK